MKGIKSLMKIYLILILTGAVVGLVMGILGV